MLSECFVVVCFYFGVSPVFSIHNGKWTEWRPIWSVIIGVLTKSDDREAGVHLFIMSMIQTKLDGTKYCYQVIKTMTKFEKKTRHRLYVFIKKKTINLAICNTCYALDARRETQAGSPQDHMATDS